MVFYMEPDYAKECDTVKGFLEQLAADRGTLLTEEEYQSLRSSQLRDLEKPSRSGWLVAAPGLAFLLIGIGIVIAILARWNSASADAAVGQLMLGILLTVLGSCFSFGYIRGAIAEARRTYPERVTEVDELLRSGLITAKEHETIRRSIESDGRARVSK